MNSNEKKLLCFFGGLGYFGYTLMTFFGFIIVVANLLVTATVLTWIGMPSNIITIISGAYCFFILAYIVGIGFWPVAMARIEKRQKPLALVDLKQWQRI